MEETPKKMWKGKQNFERVSQCPNFRGVADAPIATQLCSQEDVKGKHALEGCPLSTVPLNHQFCSFAWLVCSMGMADGAESLCGSSPLNGPLNTLETH